MKKIFFISLLVFIIFIQLSLAKGNKVEYFIKDSVLVQEKTKVDSLFKLPGYIDKDYLKDHFSNEDIQALNNGKVIIKFNEFDKEIGLLPVKAQTVKISSVFRVVDNQLEKSRVNKIFGPVKTYWSITIIFILLPLIFFIWFLWRNRNTKVMDIVQIVSIAIISLFSVLLLLDIYPGPDNLDSSQLFFLGLMIAAVVSCAGAGLNIKSHFVIVLLAVFVICSFVNLVNANVYLIFLVFFIVFLFIRLMKRILFFMEKLLKSFME